MNADHLMKDYLSKLDIDYIKFFRRLVTTSIEEKFIKIDEKHESISTDNLLLREFIADDAIFMEGVSKLADELSIVALYKVFEKKHKEIVVFHFKDYNIKKYSYWNNIEPKIPKEIKDTDEFLAINELRLLNNAIKHEGCVSKELSDTYSAYGQIGSEFVELGKTYERLESLVVSYIESLYQNLNSKCKKT